ncbi:hypothetical protein B0H66DRAFT_84954 [Apodospora peruviana]|uniref:non-specific serine/threonine protein kinase n=1 Tax=Apodospora peruviana TaxID=516989 RepID=A0AAE0MFU7_9PEZI|nr:hypothetical protein B0H66DRAFT_84954 [Apodospora peruviana]
MDHRSSTRNSVNRQPLGDATKRVNNTSITYVDRQGQANGDENILPLKHKKVARSSRSNPAQSTKPTVVDQNGGCPPAAAGPTEPTAVNPRLSAITQDSRDGTDSRRVSQFSNVSSNASSTRQLKTHIGPWQLGKTLGKGSQARVRLARHRVSHQLVAIKIVAKNTAHITGAGSLANLDKIDYRSPTTSADGGLRRMPLAIEREVAILKLIQHPNIIKLHDIWENRAEIYLVTEYVEKGDMFEFINWNGRLEEEEAIFYFRQMMSALEYCHTFNICHRDLKPENILLKANGQVKIADFGMAALQQDSAHQLRTACGSPHYAAPELLKHQHYKGSAVDIWSMGVILFAMLAGRLPFDENDINIMLSKAKRAEYTMPTHISREAKDLIRRILVVEPAHRITMKQMWRHALIKKYNYLDNFQMRDGQPQDVLRNADMRPIHENEVDIQILRQLKSLWHAYTETDLKGKLAEEKANDQKLFYWLLYRHRESQLENYNNDVPISKSDFHHLKPPNWGKRISTCEFTQAGRNGHVKSVSRFTVISNVAEMDEVGTVKSYDPYHSSQILKPCGSQVSHAKIVVHRNTPESGLRSVPTSVSHTYRSYRSVNGSFRQRPRMNSQRTNTTGQLISPRGSMGSIRSHHSTPRVRVNPRTKRTVDFSNLRIKDPRRRPNQDSAAENPSYGRAPSSPSRRPKQKIQAAAHTRPVVEAGKPKEDSLIWNEELQQLNYRIAKDLDEAFRTSLPVSVPSVGEGDFRESSPFSLLSLGTPSLSQFPLPPTSVPVPNRNGPHRWDSRPLPPIPTEETPTPESTRFGDNIEPAFQASKFAVKVPERRTVSEPVYKQIGRETRPLPSICESASEEWKRDHYNVPNSANTPTPIGNKGLDYLASVENTIRIVDSPATNIAQGSVNIPAPLNVRKVSRGTLKASEATSAASYQDAQRRASDGTNHKSYDFDNQSNDANAVAKKRVSSWFKRSSKDAVNDSSFVTVTENSARSSDEASLEANGPQKKKSFNFSFWKATKDGPKMSLADSDLDEMPTAEYGAQGKKRKTGRNGSSISVSNSLNIWSDNDTAGGRKIEVQQNWLARLFRVKPATRYVCFGIQKRRGRQEVAILLRSWRKYGIKDVEVDKERNIVFARVAAKNYLNLKEVAFAVELMTVIEHGKRNHLSIARFTQEKGAASSFNKVVDEICSQFGSRGLLITDKRKVNMMIKTLNS